MEEAPLGGKRAACMASVACPVSWWWRDRAGIDDGSCKGCER